MPYPRGTWNPVPPIPKMDHTAGFKESAFSWAMGRVILRRISDGWSMKAITRDPRMPAYCTVYQWMKVVPEFGEAVRLIRHKRGQSVRDFGRPLGLSGATVSRVECGGMPDVRTLVTLSRATGKSLAACVRLLGL